MKTHKDLIVWQKAIDLVVCVYSVTKEFPSSELYALTNQIRRCATSIPGNIAEGAARKSEKEFIQFLHISLGSGSELETYLIISQKLNYIDVDVFNNLKFMLEEINKMLVGLIHTLKEKQLR